MRNELQHVEVKNQICDFATLKKKKKSLLSFDQTDLLCQFLQQSQILS